LIERFDLFRVSKAPAVFSYKKLDWMNGVYIRDMAPEDLFDHLLTHWQNANLVPDPCPEEERERLRPLVPLVQERLKRLEDIVEWSAFLFHDVETPPAERLVGKKMTPHESLEALQRARDVLAQVEPFEPELMEAPMRALAEELGIKAGQLFGILRWAATGQAVSPPLFGSLAIIGRDNVLSRLASAEVALASAGQ
jgi:glutamyl-tRNA synthetase